MAVYTDNPVFAASLLPPGVAGDFVPLGSGPPELHPALNKLFGSNDDVLSSPSPSLPWPHLLLTEFSEGSQYDQIIELARGDGALPHGLVTLAGSGSGFHGFKNRSWSADPGNLHLVVHLAPQQPIERFEVAFTILAALSVVDALNQIGGLEGKARIKWVNDILLDGAKVGGILAYTQSQGSAVTSAVLGIGLNVETTPSVEPTPFVPQVTSVREFLSGEGDGLCAAALPLLLGALAKNYVVLLAEGVSPLLQRYRDHSAVIGQEVTVFSDRTSRPMEKVAEGRVEALGEKLELILQGRPEPVLDGRLVFGREHGKKMDGTPGAA